MRDCLGRSLAVAILGAIAAVGALAAAQPQLSLQTTAEKEVKVQREGAWITERVPLNSTNPGDVVVYTITYANAGSEPIVGAMIVDPVPEGTAYILGSAAGEGTRITCSLDSGLSFLPPPLMQRFAREDGVVESQPAPGESYTHVRWDLSRPVLPGQTGTVSLKVSVK